MFKALDQLQLAMSQPDGPMMNTFLRPLLTEGVREMSGPLGWGPEEELRWRGTITAVMVQIHVLGDWNEARRALTCLVNWIEAHLEEEEVPLQSREIPGRKG